MRILLRVLAAIALVYAGYIHLHLATAYDGGSGLTVGNEFRAQFVATLVAALILLIPRRWAWLPALVVAASTLGAVLATVYLHVGAIGPLPALPHEPWYPDKSYSAVAEALVVLLALAGLLIGPGRRRRGRQRRPGTSENMPTQPTAA